MPIPAPESWLGSRSRGRGTGQGWSGGPLGWGDRRKVGTGQKRRSPRARLVPGDSGFVSGCAANARAGGGDPRSQAITGVGLSGWSAGAGLRAPAPCWPPECPECPPWAPWAPWLCPPPWWLPDWPRAWSFTRRQASRKRCSSARASASCRRRQPLPRRLRVLDRVGRSARNLASSVRAAAHRVAGERRAQLARPAARSATGRWPGLAHVGEERFDARDELLHPLVTAAGSRSVPLNASGCASTIVVERRLPAIGQRLHAGSRNRHGAVPRRAQLLHARRRDRRRRPPRRPAPRARRPSLRARRAWSASAISWRLW